jgi:hypothetical protein
MVTKFEDMAGHEQGADHASNADDDWSNHPPYVPSRRRAKHTAKCFCGHVVYSISEYPLDAKCCHCHTCQTIHGASMQWAAIFKKEAVSFEPESLEYLTFYNTEENNYGHNLPCKLSCSACGTLIADEGRNMFLSYPSLFGFNRDEVPKSFKPTAHIFYGQRSFDVVDGIVKWEGHKDHSKKVPEKGK